MLNGMIRRIFAFYCLKIPTPARLKEVPIRREGAPFSKGAQRANKLSSFLPRPALAGKEVAEGRRIFCSIYLPSATYFCLPATKVGKNASSKNFSVILSVC